MGWAGLWPSWAGGEVYPVDGRVHQTKTELNTIPVACTPGYLALDLWAVHNHKLKESSIEGHRPKSQFQDRLVSRAD